MAVYVDSLMDWGWKLGKSCHLIGDSVEELKEFAQKLGMKLEWFQPKSFPHFDLVKSKRDKAIKLGAIELNRKDYVNKIREIRKERR